MHARACDDSALPNKIHPIGQEVFFRACCDQHTNQSMASNVPNAVDRPRPCGPFRMRRLPIGPIFETPAAGRIETGVLILILILIFDPSNHRPQHDPQMRVSVWPPSFVRPDAMRTYPVAIFACG